MLSARSERGAEAEPAVSIAALLGEALHAMGQPLTALQGCRLMPLLAAEERDQLAAEMAEQVERVTALYRDLRCLCEALPAGAGEERPRLRLEEALRHSMVAWQREGQRREVGVVVALESGAATISERTEQAIQMIVTAAWGRVAAGGMLRLRGGEPMAVEVGRRTTLVIEAERALGAVESMVGEAEQGLGDAAGVGDGAAEAPGLGLRVAEALLQMEGGRVVYNLQPFRAVIELPGAEEARG